MVLCVGCVYRWWRPVGSGSEGVQNAELPLPAALPWLHRQRSFPAPKLFLQRAQPDAVGGHTQVHSSRTSTLPVTIGSVCSVVLLTSSSWSNSPEFIMPVSPPGAQVLTGRLFCVSWAGCIVKYPVTRNSPKILNPKCFFLLRNDSVNDCTLQQTDAPLQGSHCPQME